MKPTNAIIILDGYGLGEGSRFNAVKAAKTPFLDQLFARWPNSRLSACGADVGLPEGQMGNSEVGHLNLGAGRIVYQDISMISNAIKDGSFFCNPALKSATKNAKKKSLHLCGLISDGGVHSSLEHLYALLSLAKQEDVQRVYIHCITDGRDTPPSSADSFIEQIEEECRRIGTGKVATIVGRFFIMDRDNRWERVKVGYDCVFEGKGRAFNCAKGAIKTLYGEGITDEFLPACVIDGYEGFDQDDSFIFFNFRADRAREVARAASDPDFDLFEREQGYKRPFYVGFTLYDEKLSNVHTAFEPKQIKNTLSEWLSAHGKTQARVAETEKYAHVTFFFNGGVEAADKGESRHLIPSPKVETYDQTPCMSAPAVAKKAAEMVGDVDVLIMNFANCDMVGHTGNLDAATRAVECVDNALKVVVEAVLSSGGNALILADHGNAEMMAYADGSPMTAHTDNPVPLILVGSGFADCALEDGKLCDVAPTFLSIMGLDAPAQMTGKCLIRF